MLMKWVIPAWVAGRWNCVLWDDDPNGMPRRHMRLDLHRRYQQVWGTARVGGRLQMPLADTRLVGEELSFTLYHWRQLRPPVRFTGRVIGDQVPRHISHPIHGGRGEDGALVWHARIAL